MSRTQYDPPTSAQPSPKSSSSSSSRQSLPTEPGAPPVQQQASTEPSTSTPQSPRFDSSIEGYPSWLPKRPPPPAPPTAYSTRTSGLGMYSDAGPSSEPFYGVGRKPTPRSVRIVSLQNSSLSDKDRHPRRRESTDPIRAFSAAHNRVWSRATSAGLSPTLFSSPPSLPRPRFRASSLHLELLRSPSWNMRLWYYLYPLFVFAHIPLQTFFDFNAVFILLLAAKYPNPSAPGVAGSGRGWALGAAAYIACWAVQVFVVFVMYEIVYSFVRRWRVSECRARFSLARARARVLCAFFLTARAPLPPTERPFVLPIYLSTPARRLAALTSYTHFCFLQHIRLSAWSSPTSASASASASSGGVRDGLAEACYAHAQNLPTVALLLPRAGLALAALLAFSDAQPGELGLADAGVRPRDGTFFRAADQTLTAYARGVLVANAAWTAWRAVVLLVSWTGLWVLSGQGCAGLCGPRFRWEEEEDAEKAAAAVAAAGETFAPDAPLPWAWRERTLLRVVDAYEFCLTDRLPRVPGAIAGGGEKTKEGGGEAHGGGGAAQQQQQQHQGGFEGIDRVFAAVGLGGQGAPPAAARRGVLTEELFATPEPSPGSDSRHHRGRQPGSSGNSNSNSNSESERNSSSANGRSDNGRSRSSGNGNGRGRGKSGSSGSDAPPPPPPPPPPPLSAYPFTGAAAQISSEDVVPFPPSPEPEEGDESERETGGPQERDEGHGERAAEGEEEQGEEEGEEEGELEGLEGLSAEGLSAEGGYSAEAGESEFTSDDRRTSGSLSSLGRPVPSRYPFSFRRPRTRGGGRAGSTISTLSYRSQLSQALSSPTSPHRASIVTGASVATAGAARSTQSRSTNSRSTNSRSTQSTGNRESSDSPMSRGSSNASGPPPGARGGNGGSGGASGSSAIPMPPRHPQKRSRARTVPAGSPGSSMSSASPVVFPGVLPSRVGSAHTRTASDLSMTFGPHAPVPFVLNSDDEREGEEEEEEEGREGSLMDVPEAEGSGEEAEQHDSVGLLYGRASAPASRTSLRQFASGLHRRANGSRSRSASSRSRTTSSHSNSRGSESARSRAQSLIHSLGAAASRSSLDLVTRARAHSMQQQQRLADYDDDYSSASPDPMPSSPENNTFGFARRPPRRDDDAPSSAGSGGGVSVVGDEPATVAVAVPAPARRRRRHTSEASRGAPSELSVRTARAGPTAHAAGGSSAPVPIPIPHGSLPDLSTAHASLVTAPETVQGTGGAGGTPSSWGTRLDQRLGQGRAWEPA
ncbi:uncharacterized protein PHACADRAFT_32092 [Phanerochaete carnosa HHB-10118-sp]|uniref:Proteophosphoglycan ppg4 n=1 Tax=Phanerochaete carnosa (strain HHB-10118-sp) TaxID=650164 RepID=K5VW47_PHACS|nr:uncharacterized protein PHACADRAFT_32092 [Phanerochaete carnosa HHB-10118-sp]EKM51050.1 hypothetical protein PHACADRAFT_32092 [Phanerochaete carnosa HHB-10118-sp]